MEKRLERRRSVKSYKSLEAEKIGKRSRRSRKRSRKKSALPKVLVLVLLCICLGGLGWGAVRYVRSSPGSGQETALETSRQVIPETLPESGAETFH